MKEIKKQEANHNSKVFEYIHEKTHIFTYTELDSLFQHTYGTMSKTARNQRILQYTEILLLEIHYKIPKEVFNNLDITPQIAIKMIEDFKSSVTVEEQIKVPNYSSHSIDKFNEYEYCYRYNPFNKEVIEYKMDIKNHVIQFFRFKNEDNKECVSKGLIMSTSSMLFGYVESLFTGNSMVFKVLRSSLDSPILLLSYLGDRRKENDEIAGTYIYSKNRINDEVASMFAVDELDFTERKKMIDANVTQYIANTL